MIAALGILLAITAMAVLPALEIARRRRRLNEGLHELRRPLQMLALCCDQDPRARECLRQARFALRELDRSVNGGPAAADEGESFELSGLIERARLRWSAAPIKFAVEGTGPVSGDPAQLGLALDNLIANAVEHGAGEVSVEASRQPDAARLRVANRTALPAAPPAAGPPAPPPTRPRGHGLRIAARIASDSGGRLTPPQELGGEMVTQITLPSAGASGPR